MNEALLICTGVQFHLINKEIGWELVLHVRISEGTGITSARDTYHSSQ
ncbi:hypothetical protein ALT721_440064 [Alteromonas alvinellae]